MRDITKALKAAALFAGIILFAAACNRKPPTIPIKSQTPPVISPANPEKPVMPSAPTVPMQTYTKGSYDFSFEYPNGFTFVTPTYGSLQNQIVQLQMGNSAYPKTNFADADFTVSQDYATSLAACLKLPASATAQSTFSTTQTINGVQFYSEKGGGAAAGNFYASVFYRTYHGTDCIELTETIHTGDIDNYPPGTVTQVDQTPIQTALDQILDSFKFTK